ncbi:alpha/beta hydrolase [Maribacter halichondriae]|uniref:alpha/beta hydrolase n=1 Tax=Maribacter halichondriae TaxID=2980554 RepID=UPI0023581629|nr:alpha/beta hydrolase [Maribacter sp. Hal144]
MKRYFSFAAIIFASFNFLIAQNTFEVQGDSLNNLVLPKNMETSPLGTLGDIKTVGEGKQDLLLIAGWGFDPSVFDDFVKNNKKKFKMHLITLPGFGNTKPQELPSPNISYGKQIWTNGCIKGIVNYIKENNLKEVTVLSYFNVAAQIAIRLNIDYSEYINKTIVISGAPTIIDASMKTPPTLKERIEVNDNYYAPKWFKTVTKEVWNNSNFPPNFYSFDSITGKKMWDQVASVPMPIMIQYLCEFNSQDVLLDINQIEKELLVIVPGYDKKTLNEGSSMTSFINSNYIDPWLALKNPHIKVIKVENSANCIFCDNPNKLEGIISALFN